MNDKSLSLKKCLIVFTSIAITLFYYIEDPSSFHFGVPCLLKALTGWNCWGCGGQRAFHQLLHGNYQTAFYLNALVFPVSMLLVYVVLIEILQHRPAYSWLHNKSIRISTTVLVAGFTILRNVMS